MNNNNGVLKGMLLALLVIYVISPLDLAPGALDDLLLILLTAASNTRKSGTRMLPEDTTESYRQN